jgi:hypothetical protein
VWDFVANVAPSEWLLAGPLPLLESEGPAGIPDIRTFAPRPGVEITVAGRRAAFRPLEEPLRFLQGMTKVFRSSGTYYAPTFGLDVGAAVGKGGHRSVYYFTVVRCVEDVAATVRCRSAAGWISGIAVDDEKPVLLKAGSHPFLLRADVRHVPPIGRIALVPRFSPILSQARAYRNWLDRIRCREGTLRSIVREYPESSAARKARQYLAALSEGQPHAAD